MVVGFVLGTPVVVSDLGESGGSGRAVSAFAVLATAGCPGAELARFRGELLAVIFDLVVGDWHGSLGVRTSIDFTAARRIV